MMNMKEMHFLIKISILSNVLLTTALQIDTTHIYYDVQPQQIHLSFSGIDMIMNILCYVKFFQKFNHWNLI